MYREYDHSVVTGTIREDGGPEREVRMEFIHLRNQDPIMLAARRNGNMARADRITLDSRPAFRRWIDEDPEVRPSMIPRGRAGEEFDW